MDLTRYRPTDDSSAAIHRARLLAAQDAAGTDDRVAAAKEERDNLLLDGEPKALKAADDKLRSAREDAERLEAIAAQLANRHTAALRRETVGMVDDAKANVNAARQSIITFWSEHGDQLTALLRQSAEMNVALHSAEYRLDLARNRAWSDYPDDAELQQSAARFTGGIEFPPELDAWRVMMDRGQAFLIGQSEDAPPPALAA